MTELPDLSHITLEGIMNEVHQRNRYINPPLRNRKGAKPECTKCSGKRTRKHAKGKTGYCHDCQSTFQIKNMIEIIGFKRGVDQDKRRILTKRGFGNFPFHAVKVDNIGKKEMIELDGNKVALRFFNVKSLH